MAEAHGYNQVIASHDPYMTEVGRGKPCGEMLRRYWQPVALSKDVGDIPKKIKMLDEDLILFKDKEGRFGLLHDRCCHRGTSLYYGKVEDDGLRCCYHGWKFDVEGNCLEMPCEPTQERNSMVRQPWYPVQEYHGLIYAYMGPPEKKPAFPKIDLIEEYAASGDYQIMAVEGLGTAGDIIQECNWLQLLDNAMDPFHVFVLHSGFSGTQFTELVGKKPQVDWEYTDEGIRSLQTRSIDDKSNFLRVSNVLMPNVRFVGWPMVTPDSEYFGRQGLITWITPFDDTHTNFFSLLPIRLDADGKPTMPPQEDLYEDGRTWFDLTEEERRAMPSDQEAIVGQGPITKHRDEHLVTSDKGVMLMRRLIRKQIDAVQEGNDPLGFKPDGSDNEVVTTAGNFVVEKTNR